MAGNWKNGKEVTAAEAKNETTFRLQSENERKQAGQVGDKEKYEEESGEDDRKLEETMGSGGESVNRLSPIITPEDSPSGEDTEEAQSVEENGGKESLPETSREKREEETRLRTRVGAKGVGRVKHVGLQRLVDEDSVQLFLSTDRMEKEEAHQQQKEVQKLTHRPTLQRQYSESTKKRHELIIRRILRDFDLQECLHRYRNLNAYDKTPPANSLADFRFRSELIRLMGTEVIRISDQSWAGRFQQTLREDYERMLKEKEQALARAEHDRQYKLHMESVIGDAGANLTRELTRKVKQTAQKHKSEYDY